MSEDNLNQENIEEVVDNEAAELKALKQRADMIGVKYSPNIGLETLRERVNAKLGGSDSADTEEVAGTPAETKAQRFARLRKDAIKLHRVEIICHNSHKKEWEGEVFTVSNNVIGTVKRYVPFGVVWHVEDILLKLLEQKKYQNFYWYKDPKTGQKIRKGRLENEFTVVRKTQLTEKELAELKAKQELAKAAE